MLRRLFISTERFSKEMARDGNSCFFSRTTAASRHTCGKMDLTVTVEDGFFLTPLSEDPKALQEKYSYTLSTEKEKSGAEWPKISSSGHKSLIPHPLSADVKPVVMATGLKNSNLWETLGLLEHMEVLVWYWAKSWKNKSLTNTYMLFLSLLRCNVWNIEWGGSFFSHLTLTVKDNVS